MEILIKTDRWVGYRYRDIDYGIRADLRSASDE